MSSLSRSIVANITGLKRGFREINYMKPKTLGSTCGCPQNTSSFSSSRGLPSSTSQDPPLCSIPSSSKTFFPPRPSPCPSVCLSAQDQPHSQAATAPTLSILRGPLSSMPSLQGSGQNPGLEAQGGNGESAGSRVLGLDFRGLIGYFLPVWTKVSCFSSLGLNFFICKTYSSA